MVSTFGNNNNGGFAPLSGTTNTDPRYKSTAYAEGVLYDPATGIGITGATGKFTLYRDGTQVFLNRTMAKAADQSDGWVRCAVADTELATHGLYQWSMVLTSPDSSLVLTDTGTFTV